MSEWGIALIAAGSAILGSIVTGFFAWKAGHRQAVAAEVAGQAQARALISTVQATLDEQRRTRVLDHRRQAYVEFLDAAQCCQLDRTNATRSRLMRAESMMYVEGPQSVAAAASQYAGQVLTSNHEETEGARVAYLMAVHTALEQA
ncbi:hypothetical protein [Streptomyces vietnamensis]|uniref:DUF2489 domain-containing protein n=1 Tax=Streptomyces vietnamensis TaxID=362257 RepID=A0A0B5ILC1_9ACTN|nr:hypothetical protein [Streptomyces vietnamensis]AJF70428.1 hypothetical protein SVTN_40325 [Streptomyces vietnamensis]